MHKLKEGNKLSQIIRKKLYEEVMTGIIEMIRDKKLGAGERIEGEKELASLFGVSRMVIRESLSVLQSTGIIEVKHGSGIYVKDRNERLSSPTYLKFQSQKETMLNILELREGIEAEGAYFAALRADQDDIEKLQSILTNMKNEIESGGSAAAPDFDFHLAVIRATRNPVYIQVFDEIIANIFYEGLKASHEILKTDFGPRLVVLEEHNIIFEHIKNKKAESARKVMRAHLQAVGEKLKRLL
jgi:GntR family transcriptional repressor for pyruvate dehydrogenase complex